VRYERSTNKAAIARPAGEDAEHARPAGEDAEHARPAGEDAEHARPAGEDAEHARPAGEDAPGRARPTGEESGCPESRNMTWRLGRLNWLREKDWPRCLQKGMRRL